MNYYITVYILSWNVEIFVKMREYHIFKNIYFIIDMYKYQKNLNLNFIICTNRTEFYDK